MRDRVTAKPLGDGRRLHLSDVALDVIVAIDASPGAVEAAHRAAADRFRTLSDELGAEAGLLRQLAEPGGTALAGAIARRMWRAVRPFAADRPVRPIDAAGGAIAEEVLAAAMAAATLDRVAVIIGGDVALHLSPGFGFRAGLAGGVAGDEIFATADIRPGDMVRGVAVGGRHARRRSPGIADAVTVFAQTAAKAAAASSVIADAIDLPDHPAIVRAPVQAVGPLSLEEIDEALARGRAVAEGCLRRGLIAAAVLNTGGETLFVGPIAPTYLSTEPARTGREGARG
ncbi:MAG TPA: UPF0280 family protein [Methylomirabilota bacterium]|nr:UPF0280 family protein [Methylomirabilota bacterium]